MLAYVRARTARWEYRSSAVNSSAVNDDLLDLVVGYRRCDGLNSLLPYVCHSDKVRYFNVEEMNR